jgi:hypothetical protein
MDDMAGQPVASARHFERSVRHASRRRERGDLRAGLSSGENLFRRYAGFYGKQ